MTRTTPKTEIAIEVDPAEGHERDWPREVVPVTDKHRCSAVLQHLHNAMPTCTEPAVWRVRERRGSTGTVAYYCDGHLPVGTQNQEISS